MWNPEEVLFDMDPWYCSGNVKFLTQNICFISTANRPELYEVNMLVKCIHLLLKTMYRLRKGILFIFTGGKAL